LIPRSSIHPDATAGRVENTTMRSPLQVWQLTTAERFVAGAALGAEKLAELKMLRA
jgi:hypothetical protein